MTKQVESMQLCVGQNSRNVLGMAEVHAVQTKAGKLGQKNSCKDQCWTEGSKAR